MQRPGDLGDVSDNIESDTQQREIRYSPVRVSTARFRERAVGSGSIIRAPSGDRRIGEPSLRIM